MRSVLILAVSLVVGNPALAAGGSGVADGMTGAATVGGYRIELVGTANVKNLDVVPRLRRNYDQQPLENFAQFGNNANFNFPGGGFGGAAAAGGGGNGVGFGGADGPNFGVALKITEADPKPKRRLRRFVHLAPGASVVEQDGETVKSSSEMIELTYPEFERQFAGAQAVYVQRTQNPNRLLKEIRGELKVYPGRLLEASFSGTKPGRQRVEGEEFELRQFEQTAEGIQFSVAFPMSTLSKKARNLQEKMQAMMSSSQNLSAVIEDSEGRIHEASGMSSGSTGGGGFQSFSFNGVPGGGQNFQGPAAPVSVSFRFQPLPQNAGVKSIRVRMADVEGPAEVFPFTIEVMAVPEEK
jgi:hypothetical protein